MDETTVRILDAINSLEEEPRWGYKKLPDSTKLRWIGWVMEVFDSVDDFERAVDMSLYGDVHFPSVKSLREKIVGNKESEATVEWQKVLKLSNSTAHHLLPTVDLSSLSERAKAALNSIGGLAKVANTDMDKLTFLEKQFTQSHATLGQAQVKQLNTLNPPVVNKQIEGGQQ